MTENVYFIHGDALDRLRQFGNGVVHTCVTSPPYFGLRDYGQNGQIGLEPTPDEYVSRLVEVFREVKRVLRDDGTLWLNLGDSYSRGFGGGSPGEKSATNVGAYKDRKPGKVPTGLNQKDLIGIPWRVAFALQADGWILRQDIVWHKPNAMPESVKDRCTKSHEFIFMFAKSEKYYYDNEAIKEVALKGAAGSKFHTGKTGDHQLGRSSSTPRDESSSEFRNKRSVWTVTTKPFREAHFATFPPDLIEPCVLAGSPVGGVVLDPFGGAGTTNLVAKNTGRIGVSIELNAEYIVMAERRCAA